MGRLSAQVSARAWELKNAAHHGAVDVPGVRGFNCGDGRERCYGRRLGLQHGGAVDGFAMGEEWEQRLAGLPPACLRSPSSESESAGVKVTASASEVSRAAVMVTASARKKLPVTPVVAIRGRKTTTGVMVEKTSGVAEFVQRKANGGGSRLARVAMDDDVFDYNDGVVDDQADGGSQAAQGHQVERLPDDPEGRGS